MGQKKREKLSQSSNTECVNRGPDSDKCVIYPVECHIYLVFCCQKKLCSSALEKCKLLKLFSKIISVWAIHDKTS